MSKFKEQRKKSKITFADLTIKEERSNVVLVEHDGKTYGISTRRLEASSEEDDVELRVGRYGKYLIPADSIESTDPDW